MNWFICNIYQTTEYVIVKRDRWPVPLPCACTLYPQTDVRCIQDVLLTNICVILLYNFDCHPNDFLAFSWRLIVESCWWTCLVISTLGLSVGKVRVVYCCCQGDVRVVITQTSGTNFTLVKQCYPWTIYPMGALMCKLSCDFHSYSYNKYNQQNKPEKEISVLKCRR